MESELVLSGDGRLLRRERDPWGKVEETPLLDTKEVCRILGRSLRQIYRLIESQRLRPVGKFLDQWVFSKKDIEDFVPPRRGRGARLPEFVRPFFWSHPNEGVDPSGYADFVVTQILQHGDWGAIQWVWRRYGAKVIGRVLNERRGIDPPTRSYWALILGWPKKEVETKWWLKNSPTKR